MWASLIARLASMMQSQIGRWVATAMLAVGIGVATNTVITGPGMDALMDTIQAQTDGGSALRAAALNWFAFFNMDKAITMVMSAYASRASIRAGRAFLVKR